MKAFKSQEGKAAIMNYYNMLLEKSVVTLERLCLKTSFGDTFVLAAGNAANPPVVYFMAAV